LATPAAPATVPVEAQLGLLRSMVEIRLFEDRVEELFLKNLIRGTTHLCQGQEAVAVGACAALRPGDTMTCTYRGHGAVLAKGAPLDRAFGELLGRAPGLCGGKSGSMHLTDLSVGALGSFAVIGAHLPITAGAALASWYRGDGGVSLCFFGDGATNIGAFHEALNFAAILKLPAIFVCENNLYGEYSPIATTTPIERLADRAAAYAMASERVDGNDVLLVRATVERAAERARAGEGPTLIEALTYRHKGHSRSDPARYRPAGELEQWLERDPIRRHREALLAAGVAEEDVARVEEEARVAVEEAAERALAWPHPDVESRLEQVYA
jgi:pyruvate dehydrogenase E1 component alpha subunit